MYPDFILQKLKAGDEDAFNFIFRNYYQGLVLFAMDYIPGQDMAEEVVQGIFVKLWKDREKILINTSLKAYLLTSVKNKCLDLIKHKKIRKKYEETLLRESTTMKGENDFLTYELKEKIDEAVNNLPEKTRQIFNMSRFENKKYREIAKILNISVKTVEANIGKALVLLRKELKEWL